MRRVYTNRFGLELYCLQNITFLHLMGWLGSKHQYQHSLFTKGVNALNGFLKCMA